MYNARMPENTKRDLSPLYVPGAIVIAGIIIGVSLIVALSPGGANVGGNNQEPIAVDIADVDTSSDPYIGERDADVVLAYWSDFQCPYCKAVEIGHPQIPTEPALPRIIEEYVNTGKVKIVFKDYAFLGEDSTIAALYGRAVWDLFPNKYYEWREAMYDAQDEEHGGFGNEATILTLTRGISGIDADALKARVASNRSEYQRQIDEDREEGTRFGIQGTPGFITGTTMIPGAVPFDQFKSALDAQL